MKLYLQLSSKQILWLNRDSGCGTVIIIMVLWFCQLVLIHSIVMILRREYSDVPL